MYRWSESNFDAESDLEPFRALDRERRPRIVQIHCTRDEEELLEAFAKRAESGERHPGHGDEPEDVDEVREKLRAGLWDALDLPGDLIGYDKGDDEADLAQLAERVRELAGLGVPAT